MANINLVNWREKRRLIQNTRFFVITGVSVTISVVLALIVNMIISAMITGEKENIAYIANEIKGVEDKIKQIKDLQEQKDLLLARRNVIESLQDSRPFVVNLFDNLARVVPEGIVVNQISRKDNELVISGDSDSNESISELMKNVQRLRWVSDARLGEIKAGISNEANQPSAGSGMAVNKINSDKIKIGFKLDITLDPKAAGG